MFATSRELSGTLVFPVSCTGGDAVGEVEDFSVFVSTDGGAYTPFLQKTKEVSGTFVGEAGKRYDFICIARDTAGNVEVQAPVAETGTLVNPAACRAPGKSVLLLKSKQADRKDKLVWKWLLGDATAKGDFGAFAVDTTVNLVISDGNGVVGSFSVPPNPLWEDKGQKGFVKKIGVAIRRAQSERKNRNELNVETARAESFDFAQDAPVEAQVVAPGQFFHKL